MKRVILRSLALLLILSMSLGLMAACAGDEPTTTPPTGEDGGDVGNDSTPDAASPDNSGGATAGDRMEISIMHWDIELSLEGDEMLSFIEDKFNVTLVGKPGINWENFYEIPFNWAASGEFPDIISGVDLASWNGQTEWINDGLVRALPDDLSAYPNVQKAVGAEDVQVFAVNGQNYFLPRLSYPDPGWWCMDRGILNRKDWREALGFDIPVTEQDFIDLCVAYATMDPAGKGAGYTKGMHANDTNTPYSQSMASFGYTDFYWVMNAAGEVVLPCFEETAIPLMDFYRRLNKAGGLDVDFVTDDHENGSRDKFATDKIGMVMNQVTPKGIFLFFQTWSQLYPDVDQQVFFDSIEILRPPVRDGQPVAFSEKTFWSETYINANVDDEKMDRILQIFDYLLSEEGNNLVSFGFEGKDWEKDANGDIVLLTEINPETGNPKRVGDVYPFAWSLNYLASWNDGSAQYVDPGIPLEIRDMCKAELEYRLANWYLTPVDWAIAAIDVAERNEMGGVEPRDEWSIIMLDTSNKSTEALYAEMLSGWLANGYQAAKDAMTAEAANMGY